AEDRGLRGRHSGFGRIVGLALEGALICGVGDKIAERVAVGEPLVGRLDVNVGVRVTECVSVLRRDHVVQIIANRGRTATRFEIRANTRTTGESDGICKCGCRQTQRGQNKNRTAHTCQVLSSERLLLDQMSLLLSYLESIAIRAAYVI